MKTYMKCNSCSTDGKEVIVKPILEVDEIGEFYTCPLCGSNELEDI